MSKTIIVAAGSPSTLFATAGFCSAQGITPEQIRNGEVTVILTQAFQVGKDPRTGKSSPALAAVEALGPEDKVVLIGLPVNNREPQMTTDFVRAIGSRLVGTYDEHEADRWGALQAELGLPADKFHTPGKGDGHLSAASIIGGEFEAMPRLWVTAGDWADNRQLEVSAEAKALATDVDNAVKAKIADNAFRVTVIQYLLGDSEASKAFEVRLAEGKAIEQATNAALAAAEQNGNVLVIHQPSGTEINQTSAMFAGYRKAPFVAITGAKSGEGEVVVVGCNDKHPGLGKTNLLEVFKAAGLTASGIPGKATVHGRENLGRMVEALNALK